MAKKKKCAVNVSELSSRAREDFEAFVRKHPGVNVNALLDSETFLRFCGDRLGRVSFSTLYDDYAAVVRDISAAVLQPVALDDAVRYAQEEKK